MIEMKCKCDYKQFRKYMKQLIGDYIEWLFDKLVFLGFVLYPVVSLLVAILDFVAVSYTNYFYGVSVRASMFMNPVVNTGVLVGFVVLCVVSLFTIMVGGNR